MVELKQRTEKDKRPKSSETNLNSKIIMMALIDPMFAAAGYSLIYLLMGGGLGGAVLIFIVAKMLGK